MILVMLVSKCSTKWCTLDDQLGPISQPDALMQEPNFIAKVFRSSEVNDSYNHVVKDTASTACFEISSTRASCFLSLWILLA
jgi:hypothetical protein